MTDSEKLNMRLRSFVLEHSIRQERTSANIIKSLLRIVKNKTKTLGNKTSSLSFKNKIDLLHDLEEIDDEMYKHLVKFMEIRNQFAHNHECSSLLKLKGANSELTNHLKSKFPNKETDEEKSLFLSYVDLFKLCHGKLLIIEHEYNVGLELDFNKYVNNEVCERMDTVLNDSIKNWKEFSAEIGPSIFPIPAQEEIDNFIICFKTALANHRVKIFEELNDDYSKVFKRKVPLSELKNFRKPKTALDLAKIKKPNKKDENL